MVFVDTGAWFALHVPSDPNHRRAVEWLYSNKQALVTTDYVVDETLTLLCMRRESRRAIEVGRLLLESELIRIHHVSRDDFRRAWNLFQRTHVSGWSFTDCTSKIVLDLLAIRTAFAFDDHFRQFGTVEVVPH